MRLFEVYKKALKDRGTALRQQAKATADLAAAQREKLGDEIIKGFYTDVETHEKAEKDAEERCVQAAEGFFSLYTNLLSVEARIAWDNIATPDRHSPLDGPQGKETYGGTEEDQDVIR